MMRFNDSLSPPRSLAVLAFPCMAACASSATTATASKPVQTASAVVAGPLVSEYAVPPALPHGDVKVATLGIATLEPQLSQVQR